MSASTARSWRSRFAGRAGALRPALTGVLLLADPLFRPPVAAGSPGGDCLAALEAVTAGLRRRFPVLAAVAAHEVAGHLTGGVAGPGGAGHQAQHDPACGGRGSASVTVAWPAMDGGSRAFGTFRASPRRQSMTAADREAAARRQRAQTIALWRWALVEPAMDPALTARQRGQVVRELAAREHEGPSGRLVAVSRRTIDRWVVARRAGGFDALVPAPRQCAPRTDADVVELAAGLKMENPARTAAQVRRILAARLGWAPSERAIQRWFAARELTTRPGGQPPQAFGRFQAGAVNEIWTADLMNGPKVAGKATFLAGIIDDNSRFLTGSQFIRRPDAVRFAGVLRAAIARHGIPRILYTDHGSCFTDSSLARTCTALGIKLTHSQPGRPMGRGKVERVFETVQQQFLVEVTGDEQHPARRQVTGLEELNDLLDRWVRAVYHARPHSGTGETPQAGTRRPGRRSCLSRCCCARRSPGARSGWSATPPPCPWRETCTPSTRSWPAGRWSRP